MSDRNYDVIIIGSGAGGGTLARHLAPTGKAILLLERGDWLKREPENWSVEEVFVKNRYVSSDTWRDKNDKPFKPGVHYFVGGAPRCMARHFTACAERISVNSRITTACRQRGPSATRRWNCTTPKLSICIRHTARVEKTRPNPRRANFIPSRRCHTSPASRTVR